MKHHETQNKLADEEPKKKILINELQVAINRENQRWSRTGSCHLHLLYPVPSLHQAAHANTKLQSKTPELIHFAWIQDIHHVL